MKTIGIIGAGQLGSRHLQALANVNSPLTIFVADINEQSLNVAQDRFNEVNMREDRVVHYVNDTHDFPEQMDIIIVATNSIVRRTVVEKLLERITVKHLILEKFLFPKLEDYECVFALFNQHKDILVWVNCPRRTFDIYKDIASQLSTVEAGMINVSVTGSAWGLGCNSIHFVDLFAMLTNESSVEVIYQGLDNEYMASKRAGYIDFSGKLLLRTPTGHNMSITSFKAGALPLIVEVFTPAAYWIVNESAKIVDSATDGQNWELTRQILNFPMQSKVGTGVINDLLTTNHCDLTPFNVSAQLHKALLTTFLAKYNSINNEGKDICPIT
ncbi:Gfo/Idh/MocA family oxidoreductase [Chitinophaga polysaccharea]|uniref:Gfo/Idh/MocA family oxidoreductase n=1 Tax=Chitinophaga polysaccharea TaxID=1293035 RepID=UPI0014554BD7|nr:Gfo/Idh/MocA family oxidoreductase [Chitinophaga polysaccharea]NLR61857.1 Gfo/Idh/MocA family oxidoreductase [Chitinophaga polysaccharea]